MKSHADQDPASRKSRWVTCGAALLVGSIAALGLVVCVIWRTPPRFDVLEYSKGPRFTGNWYSTDWQAATQGSFIAVRAPPSEGPPLWFVVDGMMGKRPRHGTPRHGFFPILICGPKPDPQFVARMGMHKQVYRIEGRAFGDGVLEFDGVYVSQHYRPKCEHESIIRPVEIASLFLGGPPSDVEKIDTIALRVLDASGSFRHLRVAAR